MGVVCARERMRLGNSDLSNVHGASMLKRRGFKGKIGLSTVKGLVTLPKSTLGSRRPRGDLGRFKPGNEMTKSVF